MSKDQVFILVLFFGSAALAIIAGWLLPASLATSIISSLFIGLMLYFLFN